MVRWRIFMAAKIDNTPTPTQKGASLPATHNEIRHSESVTLTTLGGRASSAQVHGHTLLPCLRASLPPSIGTPEASFSRHACREKPPATPAESTKAPKLLGTLSHGSQRCYVVALRARQSVALRARQSVALRARQSVALRARQSSVTCHLGPCSQAASRVTSHESRVTDYLDTRVEIKIESTFAESTTSPKTSRYTFDMLGNRVSGPKRKATSDCGGRR
jgi:hypothetical protein